jgi:CBS domain-containing protein
MTADLKRRLVKLRVRARRVMSRGDLIKLERWIPCPTEGAVSLERCERCEHLERVLRDPDGCETGVSCRPLEPARAPPATSWERLVKRALSAVLERTPIATVLPPELVCVTPDLGLEAIAALFLDRRISAVPVVDYERFPLGLFSKTDLARRRLSPREGDGRAAAVADFMSPIGETVREEDSLARAASLMLERRAHHLLVVDGAGHAVGMLSSFDFVGFVAAF